MATAPDRLGLRWFRRTRQRGGHQRYRWPVKTASDPAASDISADSPEETTITNLTAKQPPDGLVGLSGQPPGPDRQPGVESTVYTLSASLLRAHPETDGDYHLVLSDDEGNTIIAEIPDPAQVDSGSPFFARIQIARQTFDARYPELQDLKRVGRSHGSPGLVEIDEQAQVTGIGFFDFVHGQDGVAENGIELHPVINIIFQE